MAISVAVKETHSTSTDWTSTWVSDSFTPADNSLLVFVFTAQSNRGSGPIHAEPTISGGGLTWTKRQWVCYNGFPAPSMAGIWTAPVTTGASMSITVTDNDSDSVINSALTVYEITGHDTSSPIGATLGVTTGSRSGAYSGTLSPTPASTSIVLAGAVEDGGTLTAGTGWTTDLNVTLDGYMGNIHQRKTGATAVEYDAITTSFSSAIVGIEIKAASKKKRSFAIIHS